MTLDEEIDNLTVTVRNLDALIDACNDDDKRVNSRAYTNIHRARSDIRAILKERLLERHFSSDAV